MVARVIIVAKLRNRLKSIRHRREMDQGEFAAFLGAGPSTYSRWENQRVQPSLLWALRISRILNLRLEDWLEEISD
ncbi:MAG: helix-turn-helix domain-containing protein [Clostridia bacterium]|nr:helix-turn-helix domain-containing protein [Clostridia bacterium]